jgi:hypothetical protein
MVLNYLPGYQHGGEAEVWGWFTGQGSAGELVCTAAAAAAAAHA